MANKINKRLTYGKIIGQLFIVLCCFVLGWYGGQYFVFAHQETSVALIPLDSRPCNTQYVQVLGEMANITVNLPDEEDLDDFLSPSNEEKLWDWLEKAAKSNHRLIIYTNQLFQGGLIASRDVDHYQDTEAQLSRLENFCRQHQDKEIIVATVLPRLKPTQFQAQLWNYETELTQWAKTAAQTLSETGILPDFPDNVPTTVVKDYLALYDEAEKLVTALADLTAQGYIHQLVIGQDDSEAYSFSNLIYQKMEQRKQDNVVTIHGADELTMLILANQYQQQLQPVRILYTNPTMLTDYYPYEAADLQTIVATKLAFAGLVEDATAEDVIIIHNDPEKSAYVSQLLAKEKNNAKTHYIGLADIAYTNRGDAQLKEVLLSSEYFDRINCYAGWNTASNTLGTVFAHYQLNQYAGQQYAYVNQEKQNAMLTAYMTFKAIRWNEDQIYQAYIKSQLNPLLLEQQMIDGYTVFIGNQRRKGILQLEQHYSSYQQEFAQRMNGRHRFYFGNQAIGCTISDFESDMTFPWNRTFEVKVDCDFQLDQTSSTR